jgi:hypothetical protein
MSSKNNDDKSDKISINKTTENTQLKADLLEKQNNKTKKSN